MRRIIVLILSIICTHNIPAISKQDLCNALETSHPFAYDLNVKIISSAQNNADVTICCHGYSDSAQIVEVVHSWHVIPDHLMSFNFPDYDCNLKFYTKRTFGSIMEILPLLYVLKCCVINAHLTAINLYGFSAGGGAIINALAVLNTATYDAQLATINITPTEKSMIISAIQKGHIILDCPLKSIDEIIALRGATSELTAIGKQYTQNNMRPIDAIKSLRGLKLHILLHFQVPDEIIANRDDILFTDQLCSVNKKGNTTIVFGTDGGHNAFHASLWQQYPNFVEKVHESN